ncbi:MAG TPA: iron-sulfur cluster assembly scaffold protein [Patescibacteria group bacterium]|nr:iron-sulfur cluster assembly scaffold protein [Patescibacteria group bacterium]
MGCFSENSKLMEHFNNPHNVGDMENPDAIGHVGNAQCGDIMELYLKIENEIIVDAKFKTFGCAAAIASTSVLTDLVKGKSLSKALNISNKEIKEMLGKMPAHKYHCTMLAADALKDAIKKYKEKDETK